jgi:endoglucanase
MGLFDNLLGNIPFIGPAVQAGGTLAGQVGQLIQDQINQYVQDQASQLVGQYAPLVQQYAQTAGQYQGQPAQPAQPTSPTPVTSQQLPQQLTLLRQMELSPNALGPLKTNGKYIVNAITGQPVKLASVAVIDFGKAGTHWGQNRQSLQNLLDSIKAAGFNSIRLPLSIQLMTEPGVTANQGNLAATNPELRGKTNVELLDTFLNECAARGLGVILDMHDMNKDAYTSPLWYQNVSSPDQSSSMVFNGLNAPGNQYTGQVSENDFAKVWAALAQRYANHPAVIGADLFNEPHEPATWGDGGPTDWRRAAEKIGGTIQQYAPNWLIIVEGIGADKKTNNIGDAWWGGNLANVAKAPVRLNNVVYSPHDYGPSVWGNWWLAEPTAMRELWEREWGYIARNNIAPIWVGEFGQPNLSAEDGGGKQVRQLLDYLEEIGGHFSYWAWHEGSSGDTGGFANYDKPIPQKIDVLSRYMRLSPTWGNGQEQHLTEYVPVYRPFDDSRPGFPPFPFDTYQVVTKNVFHEGVPLVGQAGGAAVDMAKQFPQAQQTIDQLKKSLTDSIGNILVGKLPQNGPTLFTNELTRSSAGMPGDVNTDQYLTYPSAQYPPLGYPTTPVTANPNIILNPTVSGLSIENISSTNQNGADKWLPFAESLNPMDVGTLPATYPRQHFPAIW